MRGDDHPSLKEERVRSQPRPTPAQKLFGPTVQTGPGLASNRPGRPHGNSSKLALKQDKRSETGPVFQSLNRTNGRNVHPDLIGQRSRAAKRSGSSGSFGRGQRIEVASWAVRPCPVDS